MILIVDDDENFVESSSDLLRNLGLDVIATSEPVVALGMVRTLKISKVLSDFDMPEMDGIDFLEQVKEIDPSIKRVLITAHRSNLKIDSALTNLLIQQLVLKPINIEKFIHDIKVI